ncbi:MAG: DUF6491 family protein [Micropepsaceae bacterium]
MKRIATFTLAVLLAAPALAAERCLIADQIDGFRDAERDSVTLTAGSRNWHVELMGPCIGLDTALDVAAVSHSSCFGAGDTLKFSDSTGFPQTCIAKSVTYIEKDDAKDAAPEATPAP